MPDDPLMALLRMRNAIREAISATENYGYEEFNEKMKSLQKQGHELFKEFDKDYSE